MLFVWYKCLVGTPVSIIIWRHTVKRRVQQNDAELLSLCIQDYCAVSPFNELGGFFSTDDNDFAKLGSVIGENTHLGSLSVLLHNDELVTNRRLLFDGLRRNTSISKLSINCYNSNIIVGGLIYEVVKVYQEKKSLIEFSINRARLQNGGEEIITATLRNCLDMKCIRVDGCDMTDELFSQMFDAMVPLSKLKTICFGEHRIGNSVCISIANLLANTKSSKLDHLNILDNHIDTEGARIIANSLPNNTTLQNLFIRDNPFDQNIIYGILSTVLCNTFSINDIYFSNHTLKQVDHADEYHTVAGVQLVRLLNINKEGANKSHIAIEKILKHHPNIDMEPLFEWDAEEGERNLKALPYVVDWFRRAGVADVHGRYNVEERKLSAIHQFTKGMPLLFEGIKGDKSN